MKHSTTRALAALGVAALAFGTGTDPAAGHARTERDRVPVHAFGHEGDEITGAFSILTRTDDTVAAKLRTSADPGHAYTMWFVVFNDITQCSAPCNADDLFINGDPQLGFNAAQIAAARISVVWAGDGAVANPAGRLNLDGSIAEADAPDGPSTVVIGLDADDAIFPQAATGAVVTGVENAQTAEVHVIVQDHGVAHDDPDLLAQQLSQFFGACNPTCQDVQFAVHLP